MSNKSDRQIEKIMSVALGYSRVFGVYSYTYDFQKNQATFSRRIFAYTLVLDILMIVFLPICFVQKFRDEREQSSDNPVAVDIERSVAIGHAVTMCVSYIFQCTNLPKYMIMCEQLTVLRTAECSKLKRNPTIITRNTVLIIVKICLSLVFLGGTFASVYLRIDRYSVRSVFTAVYIVFVENVIVIVENQFYIGILFCGFLFELLNKRTVEVVQRILRTDRKRQQRKRMGFIMQKCCSLCDDLDLISKMHTDIYNLATSIIKLLGIQVFIIIVTTVTTQVSLCFHVVIYLGRNSFQVSQQIFYISCTGAVLITVNVGLLIYACTNAIELLSFQMNHETLRVSLSGMIDIDMTTGFYLMKTAVLNLVLLIQYDYKNL